MANRYWVGGTGTWDGSDTSHWSASSGGASGASVPTSADNVFINSSSGFGSGGTITIGNQSICNNLTSNSGHTYNMDNGIGECHGSLILESGLTFTNSNGFNMNATGSGNVVQTNGSDILYLKFGGIDGSGIWTLTGDLIMGAGSFLYFYDGTFNADIYNVTVESVEVLTNYDVVNLNMGTGTWTCTGSNAFFASFNPTINAQSSTLVLNGSNPIFIGDGKTYNNLNFTGSGTLKVYGANTFNDIDATPGLSIEFESGITQTLSNFSAIGSAGNLVTIGSNILTGDITTQSYTVSGGELLTNGTFTGSAAGWTLGAGWTYGVNNLGHLGATSSASQTPTITTNTYYLVSLVIIATDATDSMEISLGGISYFINAGIIVAGTYTFIVYTSTTDGISITISGTTVIDTVSVKKILPGQHTLSKTSGTIASDYLNLSHSNATGGATWYAGSHSTNTTDNTGWIFTDAPSTGGSGKFISLLGIG